jgi:hypothetical protein
MAGFFCFGFGWKNKIIGYLCRQKGETMKHERINIGIVNTRLKSCVLQIHRNSMKVLLLLASLFFVHNIFAQELPTPFPKEEIQKLEKKVMKMYKKASPESTDDVRFFHVFDVACDNREIKETFADTSFIKKLEYGYVKVNCRKYLSSVSMVCDSDNKIVGEWHWNAYSNHAVFFDQPFMDTLNMRQIVQVYRVLDGLKDPMLIGVTVDCKTCLIDSQKYGYKVYPIAGCSDLQWDYIMKGHPKLELEILKEKETLRANDEDFISILNELDRRVLQQVKYVGFEMPSHTKTFNVIYGAYDGFTTKGAFGQGRFFDKFNPDYSPNSNRLMKVHADVILCDADGYAFAMFDGCDFYVYKFSYLTQEMIRLGMRNVYCLVNVCGYEAIYWGVGNDGESYVIMPAKEFTYLVQDCPDDVWDSLFQVHNDLRINTNSTNKVDEK